MKSKLGLSTKQGGVLLASLVTGVAGCSSDSTTTSPESERLSRIPTVVHVVHNGEPIGSGANISAAQVRSQIDVLNEDFRQQFNNAIADSRGVDTLIEFYLADTDENGTTLVEPGINRVNGGRPAWPKGPIRNPIDSLVKPATIWSPDQYFNIWTVNFGGFVSRDLLGYAQFPSESGLSGMPLDADHPETDGIVVGYKYFGSSEKGNFPDLVPPYDLGRTATHEVGHWLGLRHIWGDGDCTEDDFVDDTPAAEAPNFGCNVGNFSCGSEDMVRNYMDYSEDDCIYLFTEGQKQRMQTVLENSPRRRELVE